MTVFPSPPFVEEGFETARLFLQDHIAKGAVDLPLLPVVAHQVLLLSGDPNADTSKLSALIQKDQALAGQILRIANSPAFSPRSPIVSLQQAISWLGLDMLTGLAFSVSVQSGVFKTTGYEKPVKELWRHALASSLYAKEIARRIRHNVENAFLCGLLHLIGKPAILHLLSQDPSSPPPRYRWSMIERLFEEFHIPVGIKLGELWKLPEPVKEAIRLHPDHLYGQAISPTKGTIITCLSDHLGSFALGNSPLSEDDLRSLQVVRDLNFYPDDMTALLECKSTVQHHVESLAL